MSDQHPAIEVQGVAKVFGFRPVLRGVDLSIQTGQSITLFGPNGAGKTTLMRLIATLARPTTGRILINGYDSLKYGNAVRAMLGVVSHRSLLYFDLTAQENLQFYARLYDLPPEQRSERITDLLEAVGLTKRAADLVQTYSRGMQQRLAIARALLHQPTIILLDEPYTGLDQDAAASLDRVLHQVRSAGRTILMTTHNIERGLAYADRVLILHRGKIAFQAEAAEIRAAGFMQTYASVTGMATSAR